MKKFLSLVLSITLALGFISCSKKEEKPQIDSEEIFKTEEKTDKKPIKGGSIAIFSYKPDTLCPLLSKNNANVRMLNIVFDGLFSINENLSVISCLANSYDALDNNTKYIINLKDGIYFHDNSLFTAKDVVYSVETIKAEADSAFYNNVKNVKSVKALGDNKVEFILDKPLSMFVNLLDFPIIKNNSLSSDKENYVPVGTGGFIYENRNEGNVFHLVRNDKWWGGEVYLNSIKVRLLPDKDTSLYALSSGEISVCPAEDNEWSKFVNTNSVKYKEYMTEYYNFIGFNNSNRFLKSKNIRKAISYAISRENILKSGTVSGYEVSNAPLRKEWIRASETKFEVGKDLNKARKLIESEGYSAETGVFKNNEETINFEIIYNEESYKKEQFAKTLKEELSAFGISASIKKMPYDLYVQAINSGSFDMFIGSMNISKELDFEFMFAEKNMFFINDEKLLESARKIQLSSGAEDCGVKISEFAKLFDEEAPFLGIGFENAVLLFKNDIGGELMPCSDDVYFGIEKIYM